VTAIPGDGDGADKAREEVVRTTQRAATLQIALVALAGLAVVLSSVTAAVVAIGNRANNQRIRDCSEPSGRCYQHQQKVTAEAIEAILRYIDESVTPFRQATTAQNYCQVELFARQPTILDKGSGPALAEYAACVTRDSVGTEQPDPPKVPLTTTTTREKG
jgi:hypothetical protein